MIADGDAAAAYVLDTGMVGNIVAHGARTGTYDFKQDGAAGQLLKGVPAEFLLTGTRVRLLLANGVRVHELIQHVQLMWPDPLACKDVTVQVDGQPVNEEVLMSMNMMRQGRVEFRIRDVPEAVPCVKDPKYSRTLIARLMDYFGL